MNHQGHVIMQPSDSLCSVVSPQSQKMADYTFNNRSNTVLILILSWFQCTVKLKRLIWPRQLC